MMGKRLMEKRHSRIALGQFMSICRECWTTTAVLMIHEKQLKMNKYEMVSLRKSNMVQLDDMDAMAK